MMVKDSNPERNLKVISIPTVLVAVRSKLKHEACNKRQPGAFDILQR